MALPILLGLAVVAWATWDTFGTGAMRRLRARRQAARSGTLDNVHVLKTLHRKAGRS